MFSGILSRGPIGNTKQYYVWFMGHRLWLMGFLVTEIQAILSKIISVLWVAGDLIGYDRILNSRIVLSDVIRASFWLAERQPNLNGFFANSHTVSSRAVWGTSNIPTGFHGENSVQHNSIKSCNMVLGLQNEPEGIVLIQTVVRDRYRPGPQQKPKI